MSDLYEPSEDEGYDNWHARKLRERDAKIAEERGNQLVRLVDWHMATVKAEQRKALHGILNSFSGYLGKRFAKEKAGIADSIDDMRADLIRRIDHELSVAVRDIREVSAEQAKIAERLANKAAERAVIAMSGEISKLRADIERLKAERNQLRAVG